MHMVTKRHPAETAMLDHLNHPFFPNELKQIFVFYL